MGAVRVVLEVIIPSQDGITAPANWSTDYSLLRACYISDGLYRPQSVQEEWVQKHVRRVHSGPAHAGQSYLLFPACSVSYSSDDHPTMGGYGLPKSVTEKVQQALRGGCL